MAPFESTDHGFISSSDDIEEGTTNQFFTQARAQASFQVSNRPINLLGDQVFDGVTYLFGGLNLTNGTITYIPPPPVPDSPSFNTLTLGNGGANLGVINLKDTTNIGIDTVAQMKGILESNNGGQLEFHTKLNGGSLTKRMAIKNNGATEIYSDGIGLSILSSDGALQQAQIYHGSTGTQD
mgnify:FL=1